MPIVAPLQRSIVVVTIAAGSPTTEFLQMPRAGLMARGSTQSCFSLLPGASFRPVCTLHFFQAVFL